MAVSRWRLIRIRAVESASISHEQRRLAELNAHEDPPTRTMLAMREVGDQVLSRYEQRYDRQYHRALDRFTRLRKEKHLFAIRSHQPTENKEILP